MPIRIMHVVDNLLRGGLENGLVNLVERMDAEHYEHVICAVRTLGPNADRLSKKARVFCLTKKHGSSLQVPALVEAIREVRPDVVHSRNWGGVEAVIAGRWTHSCSLIHSEHGLEMNSAKRDPWRRVLFRRLAYELSDKVLAVSHQLRNIHSRRTGFPARKITVIHNGVDDQRFSPDPAVRQRMRDELGISDGELCIGCVGSLFPVKSHITLLRALDTVARHGSWRLLVIGEGPERQNLENYLDGRSWKRQVSFLGSTDRVPQLLKAMDVYVLPSLYEGISNALLEAMATALPVISSSAGGNPEVVVEGESGLMFPAGDEKMLASQLLYLLEDAERRRGIGQRAQCRVREHFSLRSMVDAYAQVYRQMAWGGTQ
jgi:sugar transferase (PEP-CTERM/EpsH1 system associated)